MKQCPQCKREYDETLRFCLDDGSVLSVAYDPEETLVMARAQPLPQTAPLPKSPTQPFSGPRVLYVAILVLAVFAAGATVALLYEWDKISLADPNARRAQVPSSGNQQTENPTQEARVSSGTEPTIQNRKAQVDTSPTPLATTTPTSVPPGVTRVNLEKPPPGGTKYEASFLKASVGIVREGKDLLVVFLKPAEYTIRIRNTDGTVCHTCPEDLSAGNLQGKLPAAYRIKDVPQGPFNVTLSDGRRNEQWTVAPMARR
jgi:hypothetical protein